jgi:hypothetical protein
MNYFHKVWRLVTLHGRQSNSSAGRFRGRELLLGLGLFSVSC